MEEWLEYEKMMNGEIAPRTPDFDIGELVRKAQRAVDDRVKEAYTPPQAYVYKGPPIPCMFDQIPEADRGKPMYLHCSCPKCSPQY
jgi:hypothetical protein